MFAGVATVAMEPYGLYLAYYHGDSKLLMLTILFVPILKFLAPDAADGPEKMKNLFPGYWKKEFHRAAMHDDWAKIYADALELSKIFKKYAYFYICTDSFHDLPLQQLERALNILAEKNPEYFTEKLIETVLSDAENGSKNTYLVDFSSKEALKIEKLTDNQNKNGEVSIGSEIDTTVLSQVSIGSKIDITVLIVVFIGIFLVFPLCSAYFLFTR